MSSGTWIDSAQPERALDSFNSARSNVPQPQTDCYLQCVHVVWIVVHLVWLAALCSIALMNSRYYSKSIRKYFCVTKPDNDRNNIFLFESINRNILHILFTHWRQLGWKYERFEALLESKWFEKYEILTAPPRWCEKNEDLVDILIQNHKETQPQWINIYFRVFSFLGTHSSQLGR